MTFKHPALRIAARVLVPLLIVTASLALTVCNNPTFIEFTRYVAPAAVTPAGYDADVQWNMEMVNAPAAWGVMDELNARGVTVSSVVAVIDTGVIPDHAAYPPIAFSLFDPTDPSRGKDFYDGRLINPQTSTNSGANSSCWDDHPDEGELYGGFGPDPNPRDPGDENICNYAAGGFYRSEPSWHGSHVSGIIAAGSDGSGVRGIGPANVRILPIRVLGRWGGTTEFVTKAILYAAAHQESEPDLPVERAQVINLSLGGGSPDPTLYSAIGFAVDVGITVVAAAGNSNREGMIVPAFFDNTIAVGSIDRGGDRAWYSHYGVGLDFVAPGTAIYSTINENAYDYRTGTSMATPHVAGVVALLYALEPGLNQEAVYSILRATARDLGAPGWDKYYGHGLVDAKAALEYLINLQGRIPRAPMGAYAVGGSGGLRLEPQTLSGAQLPEAGAEYDSQSVILRFHDGQGPSGADGVEQLELQLIERYGVASVRRIGDETVVVGLGPGQEPVTVMQSLADLPEVQYSQPNFIYRSIR